MKYRGANVTKPDPTDLFRNYFVMSWAPHEDMSRLFPNVMDLNGDWIGILHVSAPCETWLTKMDEIISHKVLTRILQF